MDWELLEHHNQLHKNGMTSRPLTYYIIELDKLRFHINNATYWFFFSSIALIVLQWIEINLCEQFYLQS